MPDLIRHPDRHWIPAFAGMTAKRKCGYLVAALIIVSQRRPPRKPPPPKSPPPQFLSPPPKPSLPKPPPPKLLSPPPKLSPPFPRSQPVLLDGPVARAADALPDALDWPLKPPPQLFEPHEDAAERWSPCCRACCWASNPDASNPNVWFVIVIVLGAAAGVALGLSLAVASGLVLSAALGFGTLFQPLPLFDSQPFPVFL